MIMLVYVRSIEFMNIWGQKAVIENLARRRNLYPAIFRKGGKLVVVTYMYVYGGCL